MSGLVDTKWLLDHRDDPRLVIIDASPSDEYQALHIKNAVSASFDAEVYMSYGINTSYGGGVDLFTDPESTVPFQDGDPQYVGQVIRSWGVNQDSLVLIYDNGATFLATRAFWTLTHHGKQDVFVLDGGFEKYLMDELETETGVNRPEPGNFQPDIQDTHTVVDTSYVLDSLLEPNITLVDSNISSWYYGGFLAYSQGGHIPYAINLPFDSFFQDDMTWKSPEQIRREFAARGVHPEQEVIVYCGGNPAGSSLYFTIKYVAGYPNVRFYLRSLVGWLADERDLPLFTYGNDHLLREPAWIRWFAGQRMQSLVHDSKVRVVDARSAAEYQQGHIPWSVNIPCLELLSQNQDRAGWEKLLGGNGIAGDMEVVIYDQGDSLVASTLFWLLERLGHPKIALLNGGMAAWREQGFDLTTNQTPVALPRHKFDVALSPEVYRASVSMERPMEGLEEKEVSDISPRECLTADGRFKTAGELAAFYELRHIYKTQRIICSRPDLSEAALLYFSFKLLGYRQLAVSCPDGLVDF